MNKSVIIKIAGFITVPLLIMVVAIFFLYPYLNKDDYQQLVAEQEQKMAAELQPMPALADSSAITDSSMVLAADSLMADTSQVSDTLAMDEIDIVQAENARLHSVVDSLFTELETLKKAQAEQEKVKPISELSPEEFSQRVKSLLNLEEEDLAPILERMTNKQLVRLYNGGGTIQREKILRSLNSDKAAKLMTEIML